MRGEDRVLDPLALSHVVAAAGQGVLDGKEAERVEVPVAEGVAEAVRLGLQYCVREIVLRTQSDDLLRRIEKIERALWRKGIR